MLESEAARSALAGAASDLEHFGVFRGGGGADAESRAEVEAGAKGQNPPGPPTEPIAR
jgi:hypothetical protein